MTELPGEHQGPQSPRRPPDRWNERLGHNQEGRILSSHEGVGPLRASQVATRLPAQDLARARSFYSEKLGLDPIEERPGALRYRCQAGWFALFESSGRPSGDHTQMAFEVDDLDATVAELRARGLSFEHYDSPSLRTIERVATVEGNAVTLCTTTPIRQRPRDTSVFLSGQMTVW